MKKKLISIILIITITIIPSTNAQIDIVSTGLSVGKQIGKFAKAASEMQDMIAQTNEIKNLIEDLACTKYKFDKLMLKKDLSSCLLASDIRLINLEYSSLYRELADFGISKLTQTEGNNTFDDLINKVKAINEKMKHLIAIEQAEDVENLLNKQNARTYSKILTTSF